MSINETWFIIITFLIYFDRANVRSKFHFARPPRTKRKLNLMVRFSCIPLL